ncbi:response regulator transcription factor [Paenibacillus protaetiae]|uniref:Response regulator n=1 Tax=Paenibacillus protaetiae TaxID=2509456 RepID=A0A4V0YF61_9BACL|nr:response regulator [Paenibacillus protaetiae]QAY66591.1 response regulator [Paenibacillus protaetiae]
MNGKVLLVDDEPHITRNLEKVVPWDLLGLTVAGTAKNGLEALEKLEAEPIDLVLCDIRMPMMDGLELVRRIREQEIGCEVIMLSGYQDFAYTRKAIQYGVKDYMLKPIPYDELTGVIARIMSSRRALLKQQQEEQHKLNKMFDLINEKLLYDILMDYSDLTASSWLYAGDEQQRLLRPYALIVLDVDVGSEAAKDWRNWGDKERKLWNFAVCNVLRDKLKSNGLETGSVIQMRDGEWCVLIACEEGLGSCGAIQWAEQLLAAVSAHVKLSLYAGVYRDEIGANQLAAAYKQIQLGMMLSPKLEQVTVYSPDESKLSGAGQAIWDISELVTDALKRGDAAGVDRELTHLMGHLNNMSELSQGRIMPMLHYFVLNLVREMKEMGALPKEQEDSLWVKLDHRFGVKDLLAVIRQLQSAVGERSQDKKKQSERVMGEARIFLERNLYRDISVEEAASFVGLSASYFSLLFKQTFGVTFIEYVTRERMEKAKRLLAETQTSITQIAKEVGYAERRYFTKVFMKYTGDNPSDYRSKHLESGS